MAIMQILANIFIYSLSNIENWIFCHLRFTGSKIILLIDNDS